MMRYLPDAERARRMTSEELRASFLVDGLFRSGEVTLHLIDLDRVVLGGAVPASTALRLEAPPSLAAEYFTERRELGVLNIGGAGRVRVDDADFALRTRDCLYIGRGHREIELASDSPDRPARFYLVSYPAHTSCPVHLVRREDAEAAELGTAEHANRRRLAKYIRPGAVESAQLVMGVTGIHDGSVWNTMPPHTHVRRTEVYLYFDVPDDGVVFHLMGEPGETRHLTVHDGQAVLSPGWSIHAGCGTRSYAFCWAMGGENQDFADMQMVDPREIR